MESSLEIIFNTLLVIATFSAVGISYWKMRESNKLTRTQLENTFRAELQIDRADSGVSEKQGKSFGFFKPLLRNTGTVSATNIRVYNYHKFSEIKIDELVKERKKIKNRGVIQISGSITRDNHVSVQEIPIPLDEKKGFDIAIWIQYDYLEKKNNELIQIFHVSEGTVFEKKSTFEKHHIEEAEKDLKEKGFILPDS